jgi:hypothetical protein
MPSDWDRVTADAALLAEVRRRYRGSGDVLDQLWWIQHPGEPAPSGRTDPEKALTAARRALYRPDVRPEEALATMTDASRWIEDRALAKLAVLDAVSALSAPEPPPAPASLAGSPPRSRRRAALLLGGAAAVAILAGALIGRATATGGGLGAPAGQALAVLRNPQQPDDRLPTELRPRFVKPGSTRLLTQYGTIGTAVYAARSTGGEVCLLTVVLGARMTGSCTTEAAFSSAGLLVAFQAPADPVDDSGRLPQDDLGVRWKPDGTLRVAPAGL